MDPSMRHNHVGFRQTLGKLISKLFASHLGLSSLAAFKTIPGYSSKLTLNFKPL